MLHPFPIPTCKPSKLLWADYLIYQPMKISDHAGIHQLFLLKS